MPKTTKITAASSSLSDAFVERLSTWRSDYDAANEALATRADALSEAKAGLESLTESLDAGDDTITAAALIAGRGEVEVAERLRDAATRSAARVERRKPVYPSVALAIAKGVGEVLDVPVSIVDQLPEDLSSLDALPVAYITQAGHTKRDDAQGFIAGPVTLHYVRNTLQKNLSEDAVERALNKTVAGCSVSHRGTQEHGRIAVERLGVDVVRTYESIPVVARGPSELALNGLASRVAGDAERFSLSQDGSDTIGQLAPTIAARAEGPTNVGRMTEQGDGSRTVDVSFSVLAWPIRIKGRGGPVRDLSDAAEYLRRAIDSYDGGVAALPGLGRCVEIVLNGPEPGRWDNGGAYVKGYVTMTFLSRPVADVIE